MCLDGDRTLPLGSRRDAATQRARAKRLQREAADWKELLTAVLMATSRAWDSGADGGPLKPRLR